MRAHCSADLDSREDSRETCAPEVRHLRYPAAAGEKLLPDAVTAELGELGLVKEDQAGVLLVSEGRLL